MDWSLNNEGELGVGSGRTGNWAEIGKSTRKPVNSPAGKLRSFPVDVGWGERNVEDNSLEDSKKQRLIDRISDNDALN